MVLAVDRNAVSALVNLGWCKFLTGGSGDEAIQLIEQAIRLNPRDPPIAGRSAIASKASFLPACVKPACRRSDHDPPPCRDPGSKLRIRCLFTRPSGAPPRA